MGFLSKLARSNMQGRASRMPRRPGMIRDMRFRGRMPQKRSGFGFGLGEAIRRLKEQRDMGMKSDGIRSDPRRPSMPRMPQPIPRAEIDISALERLPMGDMPMTQDLPEVAPVGMMAGRTLQQDFPAEPRMMMAGGDEAINRSPEQELFSLQAQLENLQKQLEMDRSYNDLQTIVETSAEIDAIQKRMVEIQMEMARQKMIGENPYNLPFDPDAKAARKKLEEERRPALEEEYRSNPYNYPFNKISIEERKKLRPQLKDGGDFPDLTGDGKVTQADILKGRGVQLKAEGGEMMTQENEIDAMLGGMDSEESGAMEDLEQMAPEMEMIDQLVTMVVQMIQQGASEEEVMMFLREQGLDDEDIGTVLQLVAEMAEAEAMPQDGIGAELEQLA